MRLCVCVSQRERENSKRTQNETKTCEGGSTRSARHTTILPLSPLVFSFPLSPPAPRHARMHGIHAGGGWRSCKGKQWGSVGTV